MLSRIIRFCVKEPWLVVLLTIGVTVFGWISYNRVPIDAIPNIGENQVIVLTPWPGRSPKDIEDQVTYPLSVSLLAVPGAESVRGKSMFGYSFVQVTFKDSVDFYWARSRVSEQLGTAAAQLPDGVVPQLGPDATGLGQVFYYVLVPPKDGMSLADLRSLQDFVIKYDLQAVEGVSEVASIGGYVRQYQIEVDPDKLRFHGIPLDQVVTAIRGSNLDVGAKTVETGGMEFIVRGKGFLGSDGDTEKAIRDIEQAVIMQREGVPVRVRDIAAVQLGPDFRRGALDYNGAEAVGGVVVMRYGENPRAVIERVKEKINRSNSWSVENRCSYAAKAASRRFNPNLKSIWRWSTRPRLPPALSRRTPNKSAPACSKCPMPISGSLRHRRNAPSWTNHSPLWAAPTKSTPMAKQSTSVVPVARKRSPLSHRSIWLF